jgi:hypothetical protein
MHIIHENVDGTKDIHMVVEMPAPLSSREFLIRRVVKVQDDAGFIPFRSLSGKAAKEFRSHPLCVHARVHIGGYLLKYLSPTKTRVIFTVRSDLEALFAIDWIARWAAPQQLKRVIEWTRELGEVHVGFEHAGSGGKWME